MRRLLRQEHGFALPMALGVMMVLGILVAATSLFTLSGGWGANASRGNAQALQYAEGGLNAAYSIVWNTNSTGGDPTAAGLVGTQTTPKIFCFLAGQTCSGTNVPGTASVYGCYGGTNGTTCNGVSVAKSTWLVVSTGYATGATAGYTASRMMMGTVAVSPLNSGAVAAVWNHVFLTAPLVPNVCQTSFDSNNLIIDAPIYSIGNVCVGGNNNYIEEVGQPVDLMVGGKLILSGANTSVGADSTHPITSGIVVGGCNTTSVSQATTPCDNGSFKYWVKTKDSFVNQASPSLTNAQIEQDYTNDDPGPRHPCLAGTNPAPLNANQFDYSIAAGEGSSSLPDASGSGSSGGTFNLTPASSYACISQNGTSTGYIIWNNNSSGSITVSGVTVPAKTLAVNGAIFFDSNLTVTQAAIYSGTAIVMAAGTFSLGGNGSGLCAVSGCSSNWQGNSGNNSMLTIASLASGNSAVAINGNNNNFQGSLYTQPTGGINFNGNNTNIQGPMSVGTMYQQSNNINLKPLPVIKNMPVGAPIPPNTGVSISSLTIVK